jgi:flagellar biosynthetic protein FlhB
VPAQLGEPCWSPSKVLAPLLVAVVGAALLAGGIQSGFRLTPEGVGFKLDSLDPIAGFGRIFSKNGLIRSGIDVLKLVGIAFVALWLGARSLIYDPLFSAPVEAAYLGQFLNQATLLFLGRLLFALGVVAAISYATKNSRLPRELMMTKQEVKDEHKQAEGDMQTKAAMRRMARRLMQKQMLSAVPTADVIVTNPTHFAVALKYERGGPGSGHSRQGREPFCAAHQGPRRRARRADGREQARGPPPLRHGESRRGDPAELYQAVAGILAVVYRTHRYYFHRLKARRLEGALRKPWPPSVSSSSPVAPRC